MPELVIIIVGADDPAETSPEATMVGLRDLAARLGIADRVVFTGFRTDVSRIIRSCDIFAMPSHEEPFGLVYVEAMAAQRPVLAENSGGTPEVVVDGVTGLLAATDDSDQLASHLIRLSGDPTLRATMGTAGLERVGERFLPQRLAADIAAIYRSTTS